MSRDNLDFGKASEKEAAGVLQDNGYRIICRNYKCPLGEIDIIAEDKDTICFVEVKSRSSSRFGVSKEALSKRKQKQITKVALNFLKEKNLLDKKARFDVVALDYSEGLKKIELIKDAFEMVGGYSY
ncbi:YraN family protein [bacterium]|nr:MAG: YraN family protein [bacterium]